jgi:hypothetical protein
MRLEQVMAPQFLEARRKLAGVRADNLGPGDPEIVIADPRRHAAEKPEGFGMTVLENLRAFALIGLQEKQVRERQVHGEDLDLRRMRRAGEARQRLEKVDLRLSGRLRQGHEHLRRSAGKLADQLFDDRLAPGVAALVRGSRV